MQSAFEGIKAFAEAREPVWQAAQSKPIESPCNAWSKGIEPTARSGTRISPIKKSAKKKENTTAKQIADHLNILVFFSLLTFSRLFGSSRVIGILDNVQEPRRHHFRLFFGKRSDFHGRPFIGVLRSRVH